VDGQGAKERQRGAARRGPRRGARRAAETGAPGARREGQRPRTSGRTAQRPLGGLVQRRRLVGGVAGGARLRDTFLGRRWWILAASAAVLSALLGAGVRLGAGSLPSVWLQDALSPVERALADATAAAAGAVRDATQLWALRQENARLRAQVAALQRVVLQDAELRTQYANLVQLLHLRTSAESRFHTQGLVAEVIARDPSTWFQSLVVNKGSADGVTAGMIAITPDGLVGRVVPPVGTHSANLMLVTNPEFGVGTMVAGTGAQGAAVGVVGSTELLMTFFSPSARVHPGDEIVTSGIGGEFPRGIPVGSVVSVAAGGLGLVRQAFIRPAVDIGGVGAVLLLPPVGVG
jgi:rod shape-determining protein MreC